MSLPIALQLYTIREQLAQNFESAVRRLAGIGYSGVETAGFPGTTPREAARLFKELGLEVTSAHSPLPLAEKKNEVLDTMGQLGTKYLICAYLDPKKYYQTLDQVKAACDLLNGANEVARESGLILGYHNHWFEYEKVEGQYVYQLMLEHLDPSIIFELDAYWAKTAGPDPVNILHELQGRVPFLHVKDGPAVRDEPMVAVGEGTLDYPAIIKAGEGQLRHLIIELDRCATDMFIAVEKSFHYLVDKGLGHGRHN